MICADLELKEMLVASSDQTQAQSFATAILLLAHFHISKTLSLILNIVLLCFFFVNDKTFKACEIFWIK